MFVALNNALFNSLPTLSFKLLLRNTGVHAFPYSSDEKISL